MQYCPMLYNDLSTGCPLQLEKLGNKPFSEFDWKSWSFIFRANDIEWQYWMKNNLIEKQD